MHLIFINELCVGMSFDKKIIIVCHPVYGGSGIVATELGIALAMRDYAVHFISNEMPVRLVEYHPNIFFHEVKPYDYPLFKFPMYEGALASCIIDVALNQNINLVHTHYAIPFAYMALLAKHSLQSQYKKDIKIITTLHGTDITLIGKDKAYRPLLEYAVNASDGLSCVSNYLKLEMQKNIDIKRPIEVIYNFVQAPSYDVSPPKNQEVKCRIVCNDGDLVITHISNFRKVKKIDNVIAIFNEIVKVKPNVTLLMVGDGPERYNAEVLCRKFGIYDKLKFLGKTQDVDKILNISDLFLLPSENESFSLAALEALAHGVPVIATNIGGIPEVVEHGKNGFLHPVGAVSEMAISALKILNNENLKAEFSKSAIQRSRKFDTHKMVDEYEALYVKACQ